MTLFYCCNDAVMNASFRFVCSLESISKSFVECAKVLRGDLPPKFPGPVFPIPEALPCIAETVDALSLFWKCLGGASAISKPTTTTTTTTETTTTTTTTTGTDATGSGTTAGGGSGGSGFGDDVDAALAEELGAGFSVTPSTNCPHVVKCCRVPPPEVALVFATSPCGHTGCEVKGNTLLCLTCHSFFCRRSEGGHMADHCEATGHPLTLSPDDLSVWCYGCESYVDSYAFPELFQAYAVVHNEKFGEMPAVPPTIALELSVADDGKLSSK